MARVILAAALLTTVQMSAQNQTCATSLTSQSYFCTSGNCHEYVTVYRCQTQTFLAGYFIRYSTVSCCGSQLRSCDQNTGQGCYVGELRSPGARESLARAAARRDVLVATCDNGYARYTPDTQELGNEFPPLELLPGSRGVGLESK